MADEIKEDISDQIKEKVSKEAILSSLTDEKSTYSIQVMDNSSLPAKLKAKKEIKFEIKPPVMSTLSRLAKITLSLPEEVYSGLEDKSGYLEYIPEMIDMLIVLFHGSSKKPVPDWYKDFLLDNLTPTESVMLLQESMLKCKTDFFLHFFQIAGQMNPMMMRMISQKRPD